MTQSASQHFHNLKTTFKLINESPRITSLLEQIQLNKKWYWPLGLVSFEEYLARR